MRLGNLFALMLALPLLFVSCERAENGVDGSDTVFKLTSSSAMNFDEEGGMGHILYTIANPVNGARVKVGCNAAWITDIAVGHTIEFFVQPNTTDKQREAKIEVTYDLLGFDVVVKQSASSLPVAPGVEFEAEMLIGEYYGAYYSDAGNYYIFFTDNGFDSEGYELPNSTYYCVDLYGPLTQSDASGCVSLPFGEYTLDPYSTMAEGTFSYEYSGYWVTDRSGEVVDGYYFDSGKLLVTTQGAVLTVYVNGVEHTVTFTGEAFIYDFSDEIYDDEPEEYPDGEGFSTLTGDYKCNFSNHTLFYEYYGDYYEIGLMNWVVAIFPDSGYGDCVQFDLLADEHSYDDFFGTYTIIEYIEPFSVCPGGYDGELYGSWYYTDDGSSLAPFVDGSIAIKENGNGTATLTIDAYDDLDNHITGSWTGDMVNYSEFSATRSQSLVVNVQKPAQRKCHSKSKH